MKYLNRSVGKYGEDLAKDYLETIGFTIIDRNYCCKIGEIDIIAKDANYLCFIEVKTRYSNLNGRPLEAVTFSKQKTLYKVAQTYICQKKIKNLNFRFDVVEVLTSTLNDSYSINLIKNAFQLNI